MTVGELLFRVLVTLHCARGLEPHAEHDHRVRLPEGDSLRMYHCPGVAEGMKPETFTITDSARP